MPKRSRLIYSFGSRYARARRVRPRFKPSAAMVRAGALGRMARYGMRGYGAYLGYSAIRSLIKNYRKRGQTRRRIGERVGSGGGKTNVRNNIANVAHSTRTLYDVDLLNLPQGTGRSDRLRGAVNFRGCKICLSFVNTLSTTNRAELYCNVAVISPKDQNGSSSTISLADFFRDQSGTERGQDFSIGLSSTEMHCLPINTDKYSLLHHKRFSLGGAQQTGGMKKNVCTFDFYAKLNRQIRYQSDASTVPEGNNVYLVYWFSIQDEPGSTAATANAVNVSMHITQYFREPKNG